MLHIIKTLFNGINIEYLLLRKGWIIVALVIAQAAGAQNVGIGTNNPQEKLHVVGTVRATNALIENDITVNGRVGINGAPWQTYKLTVQNGHSYFQGNTVTTGTAKIEGAVTAESNVSVGGNLNVTNDGIINNNFRVNGRVGINGPTDASYGLIVNNSHSLFQGNTTTVGSAFINGNVHAQANLSVSNNLNVNHDAIISENFRVNGRAGIGGPTHGSYQLFVNNGNSYFQGNAIVQGDLSIKGNGSVRSAGPSHLRMGFVQYNVDYEFISTGHNQSFEVPITPFEGTSNDVKVMIAQFIPAGGAAHLGWFRVNMTPGPVSSANNSVTIRMENRGSGANHLKGTLHLLVVARDL